MGNPAFPTSSTASSTTSSPDTLLALWAGLTAIFGARWTNTMGDRPSIMARRLLTVKTLGDVEAILQGVMDRGAAHPPSLAELAAFRSAPVSDGDAQALAYRLIPSFERSTCTRAQLEAIAKANLARARALLAGAEPSAREANVLAKFEAEAASKEVVADWLEQLT